MAKRKGPRSRQRGVGLIEVSLAITVGIVLLSVAMIGVKRSKERTQTQELAVEQELIFAAADAYFRSRCSSGTLPTSVSVATLQSQGFLSRVPRNPWGASWSVTYLNSPRRAQIQAVISAPSSQIPWIADYAGAYTYSGTNLYWIHNIRIALDTSSASQMEFKEMYETSTC